MVVVVLVVKVLGLSSVFVPVLEVFGVGPTGATVPAVV